MNSQDFRQPGLFQQHGATMVRMSRLIDAALIVATLFGLLKLHDVHLTDGHAAIALLATLFFEIIASMFEFYRSWRVVRFRYEIGSLFMYWFVTCLLVTFVIYYVPHKSPIHSLLILEWFIATFALIFCFRLLLRFALRYTRAFGYDVRRAAFVGANEIAANLIQIFRTHPWMGIDILGIFDDRAPDGERVLGGLETQVRGTAQDLVSLAQSGKVDVIYIALPLAAEKRIKQLIDTFADTTVSIYYCPSFFQFGLLNARWDDVYGQPVVSVVESPFQGGMGVLKRIEDIVLILMILPLIALPMLLIGLAVKLTSPGPALYRQTRYGLDGREFKVWKFRSMYGAESDREYVQATKHDPRVTPLGAFLRRTSLDELPQFINVLLGDMSVVGPRPHPVMLNEMHRKQIHRYMVRHKVKPGITGWAQIHGCRGETRDVGAMEMRIHYDLEYLRNWSLWLDMAILARTALLLINDKKAY